MNKLRKILFTNFGWKFVSLVLAIGIWFFATNINNPIITDTVTIPLELRNTDYISDNNLVLLNEDELKNSKVNVRVKATQHDLLNFKSNYLNAYIDFKPINITNENNIGHAVTTSVFVESLFSGYEVIDQYPKSVDIYFDRLVSRNFDVDIKESGKLDEGLEIIGDPELSRDTVTINGPKAIVDKIENVSIDINLNDINEDFTETYDVVAYDENGNSLNSQLDSISPSTITANVVIDSEKEIPIGIPKWTGTVADGYKLITPAEFSPEYVTVYGPDEILDSISEIQLDPVDVSGATSDIKVTYNLTSLLADTGLTIKNGTPTSVTVKFKVEPIISKTITVPVSNLQIINEPNDYEIPATFDVSISGPETIVNTINSSNITGEIDLNNLEYGENQVEITLNLPNNIEITSLEDLTVYSYENGPTEDIDNIDSDDNITNSQSDLDSPIVQSEEPTEDN